MQEKNAGGLPKSTTREVAMEVDGDHSSGRVAATLRAYRRDDDYCNSLVTACWVLLACARALMPVWVRIWYFDSSDVAWV
jgi:hypothetical protein